MPTDVGTTMDALLGCIEEQLESRGRGVCRTGITVGAPVLGPTACCDDCGTPGGQLTVTLQRMYPVDAATFGQQARVENCRPGAVAVDLAFTLARCHPSIDAQGTPPSLDDVAPYADGAIEDAQIMWLAFQCPCDDSFKVVIRTVSTDTDPLGGCSAVGMSVTVLVTPKEPVIGS